MTQELRKLAEAANTTTDQRANMQTAQYHAAWIARDTFKNACTPEAILALLDRLEKAEKDAERLLPLLKQALSVVDGSYNEDYDEAFEGSVSEALRAEISAMEASK